MFHSVSSGTPRWGLIGAIGSALIASLCCLGPLVLLVLGVGGAWAAQLTSLEPYRPIFVGITLLFMGYAFYRVYRKNPARDCEPGRACAHPQTERRNKIVLWTVALIILALLVSPYIIAGFHSPTTMPGTTGQTVVLELQNMTCVSCVVAVEKGLLNQEGVYRVEATLEPPRATVVFDPGKTTVTALLRATTDIGYPSRVLIEPSKQKEN